MNPKALKDLTGQKFGLLKVLRRGVTKSTAGAYWLCRCACGKQLEIYGGSLRYNKTKSCGCQMAPLVHGHGRTGKQSRTYMVWHAMKQRCGNPRDKAYVAYGAQGITVCQRWLDFKNFLSDMGEAPVGTYIDRIVGTKGYYPSNCRWATPAQSNRNTSRNVWLTHRGMTLCLMDWSKLTGIKFATLWGRLNAGWETSRLLDTPVASRLT